MIAEDCLWFWFGCDYWCFFMILIWIWLLMIVYDSASLLIFSSMTLLGIWSLITVFASPLVLLTNPALRPPQRGVGGTRALAHSIIYLCVCVSEGCPRQNHEGLSVATLPIQLVLPRNILSNSKRCLSNHFFETLRRHRIQRGNGRYMFFKPHVFSQTCFFWITKVLHHWLILKLWWLVVNHPWSIH